MNDKYMEIIDDIIYYEGKKMNYIDIYGKECQDFIKAIEILIVEHMYYKNLALKYQNNYILKQKIKDKIKKIEQQGYWVDEDYYFNGEDEYPISQKNFTKEEQEKNIISVLQELLKEE